MIRILALLAVILTLATIALGASVRAADAALGCPKWPGCYAKPMVEQDLVTPPKFAAKTRTDITTHRRFAGAVGIAILVLSALVWTLPANRIRATFWAMASLSMVILQIALGLWNVERGPPPLAAMGHLLLGFSILVMIYMVYLTSSSAIHSPPHADAGAGVRWLARVGLLTHVFELILGGWTSTHYAGLACPDFPSCLGQAWPDVDYRKGFALSHAMDLPSGEGLLPLTARAAIHWAHRASGIGTYLILTLLAVWISADSRCKSLRSAAVLMSALVFLAAGLGIAAVLLRLPTAVVGAHTVTAGLLLLNAVYVNLRSGTRAAAASPAAVTWDSLVPGSSGHRVPETPADDDAQLACRGIVLRLAHPAKADDRGSNS